MCSVDQAVAQRQPNLRFVALPAFRVSHLRLCLLNICTCNFPRFTVIGLLCWFCLLWLARYVWRVSWLDDGHVEAKVIAEPWKLEDITYCLDLFRIGLASSNPVFMALAAVFVMLRLSQQPLYIGLIHSIFLNRLFLINRSAKRLLWV